MARTPRLILPNYPHHVVHRGHNRRRIFRSERDYLWYLESLHELSRTFGVQVYAYCLMPNHVHLVLDAGECEQSIPSLMKRLAGRYTRRVNRHEHRTGTLWDSRYYSSPIDSEAYLLACCRYVELNPVRAAIADAPADYRWSSFLQRAHCDEARWVSFDPCYMALAASPEERSRVYRDWVLQGVGGEITLIRNAIQRSQLTGDGLFVDRIAAVTGRRIESRGRGRPIVNGRRCAAFEK